MSIRQRLFVLGNGLFENAFPAYRPLYAAWKVLSDRRERALMRRLVRPGMSVVDVGANIGIYTAFLANLVGPSGRVHAFEPAPENFRRLQEHAGRLGNVFLNAAAVGDRSGTTGLYLSEDLNVDHRTFDGGDGRSSIEVPVTRLDDYFRSGQRVDFVKIDVQGYELGVLEGARRVLRENADVTLIVEFWPYGLKKASVDPLQVLQEIRALGFQIRSTIDPADTAFAPGRLACDRADEYCNLLLTRASGPAPLAPA